MQILIVVAIIAALFAAYHFHLLATVKAALHKSKDASPGAVTAPGSVIAPPAPVVQPADHGATPPANAGATGTQTGAVPGGDVPDANGAIAIPAIASKFPPNSRFLTVAALPFVPTASAQAFCIAANCQNVKFLEGAFVNVPDFSNYKPLAAVANPASAVAVGGAAFHLWGQAPGEVPFKSIPDCVAISNDLTTIQDVVAYCAKLPDYGTVHPVSPVAGPGFSPRH